MCYHAISLGLYFNFKLCLLRKRGLKLGVNCYIGSGVSIDPTFCHPITIGNNTTIAARVTILAHDVSTSRLAIPMTRLANVKIGNNCFIGVDSVILPGVTIGDNVVVGAGSVVTKDIPSNCVAAENPPKVLESVEVLMKKGRSVFRIFFESSVRLCFRGSLKSRNAF
jgi:maltose O-acetyltransferase